MVINKKGLWQMLEATVAIIIVAGVIFYALSQQQSSSEKEDFYKLLRPALNEIAKNSTLRDKIMDDTSSTDEAETEILSFLSRRVQSPKLNYNVTICDASPTLPCENPASYPSSSEKEIYSEERLIIATPDKSTSKIIKLYLWIK